VNFFVIFFKVVDIQMSARKSVIIIAEHIFIFPFLKHSKIKQ